MKNLFQILFPFILTSLTGDMVAQGPMSRTFTEYSAYVSERYNITCKIPKNFIELKYENAILWKFREESGSSACVFNPVIQYDNQECILLYSMVFIDLNSEYDKFISTVSQSIGRSMNKNKFADDYKEDPNEILPRITITFQFRTVLGHVKYGDIIKDSTFNFDDYVHIIAGKRAHKSFNADSVFIYDISMPLEKPCGKEYVYSTGMIIAKKNRPYFQLMWLFTEEGNIKKDKYIKMLSKKVWYNDN